MSSYLRRNDLVRRLGYKSYASYLTSVRWYQIRRRVIEKFGKACAVCGGEYAEIHHLRYSWEDMAGSCLQYMRPICRTCHQVIEFDANGVKRTHEQANAEYFRLGGRTDAPQPTKQPTKPRRTRKPSHLPNVSRCAVCGQLAKRGKDRCSRHATTIPPKVAKVAETILKADEKRRTLERLAMEARAEEKRLG